MTLHLRSDGDLPSLRCRFAWVAALGLLALSFLSIRPVQAQLLAPQSGDNLTVSAAGTTGTYLGQPLNNPVYSYDYEMPLHGGGIDSLEAITVSPNSTFTLNDGGSINGAYGNESHGLDVGGAAVINGGTINATGYGLAAYQYSTVTINGGYINQSGALQTVGLFETGQGTLVTVNGGSISGTGWGLKAVVGSAVVINGGTLQGGLCDLHVDTGSTALINGGTFPATVGLCLDALGTVIIKGGNFQEDPLNFTVGPGIQANGGVIDLFGTFSQTAPITHASSGLITGTLLSGQPIQVSYTVTNQPGSAIEFNVPLALTPAITSLNPAATPAGSSSTTLTVNGANFTQNSVVDWNGSPLTTIYVSATQLSAIVPAAFLTTHGANSVTVSTPAPGGGISNPFPFDVTTTLYVSPTGSDSSPGTQAAPFQTIQAAISYAINGDVVTLEDGTYAGPGNVDVDFGGLNITVNSVNGPAKTIIDCGGSTALHRGFYFHSYESNAVVSGLTIENGHEGHGGGVAIETGSVVTLNNCDIINNEVAHVSSMGSDPNDGAGGGVANFGRVTMTNCTLSGNIAYSAGGNDIFNSSCGGGLYNDAYATLVGCALNSNMVTGSMQNPGSGGGFANGTDQIVGITVQAVAVNCRFAGNTATYGGGIVNDLYVGTHSLTLTNCLIVGNATTNGNGGGIFHFNGPLTLQFCTLVGNSAQGSGKSGGALFSAGPATLTDDILYDDSAPSGAEIYDQSPVVASDCDVENGFAGVSNVSVDPLFVNNPTDLHLQASSPCAGAGTPISGVTTDFDGKTRSNPPTIGAYEVAANPPLSGISVSPTSLTGGVANSTGVVALAGKATSTAVISLTSSQPSALSVPSTVTINATYTTVHFTATSHGVGANTTVIITATYGGVSKTTTVTVTPAPPALASVSASPTSVVGGSGNATCVAGLTGKATSPVTITLTSSYPSALSVPGSVTIGTGYTTVHFTATSYAVSAPTTVTITATYNGVSKTTTVTVTSAANPSLAGISATPSSVIGGSANSSVQVALTGKATTTATIALSSSNPAALSVPSSVTINPGYTTKTFTATSYAVTTTQTVTITATDNGVSKTATVTVTPAASGPAVLQSLTFNPNPGYSSGETVGTVTLSGNAPSGGAAVTISSGGSTILTATVPQGQSSMTFTLTTPTETSSTTFVVSAAYNGTTINTNLVVNPTSVQIVSLTFNPNPVTGGSNAIGTVTLSANAPAGGAWITLSGAVSYSFVVPAGQNSASYTQPTGTVTSSTVYTFDASYNGATVTTNLTVNP